MFLSILVLLKNCFVFEIWCIFTRNPFLFLSLISGWCVWNKEAKKNVFWSSLKEKNTHKKLHVVGFEPTHANIPAPKAGPLDHSGKRALLNLFIALFNLWGFLFLIISIIFDFSLVFSVLSNWTIFFSSIRIQLWTERECRESREDRTIESRWPKVSWMTCLFLKKMSLLQKSIIREVEIFLKYACYNVQCLISTSTIFGTDYWLMYRWHYKQMRFL